MITQRPGWVFAKTHVWPPFRYAKGPFVFEGAFQSNAPPLVGGALHSAALLDPPNRLWSRDKNREYEKKAESKEEARHECAEEMDVGYKRQPTRILTFVNTKT
jgi:hypothetical protein